MDKNNKKRILTLIKILRKYSNNDKHLKLSEIVVYLNNEGVQVDNRKTLYDDFKTLNECGFDIEYDDGYYLLEAPFNLSEIKIIQDSIYSLKSLDNSLLENLNNKLYSFISTDEEKLLNNLRYTNKHKNKMFLQKMEEVLIAIKDKKSITLKRKGKKEEVYPLFLHRDNDYYYLYYHYLNKEKIYHFRFDNINDVNVTENYDNMIIKRKNIIETIETSTNSFSKGDIQTIEFKILNNKDLVKEMIENDFPNSIFTSDGFSLKASINNNFFSKLVAYGTDIKIIDKKIAQEYLSYLDSIISIYQRKKTH